MKRLVFSLLVLLVAFGGYWAAGAKAKKTAFLPDSDKKQTLIQLEKEMGETQLMLASVFRSPQDYPLGWEDSLKQVQSGQRQTYAKSRQLVVERYEGRRVPGWARFIHNNRLYVILAVLSVLALIWMPGRGEKGVAAAGPKKGKNNGGWRQPVLKKSGIPVDPEAADLGEFPPSPEAQNPHETFVSEQSDLEKNSFEDRFKHSLKGLSEIAKNTLKDTEQNSLSPENENQGVSEAVSVSHFEVIQSKKPSSPEPKAVLDEEDEVEEIVPASEVSEKVPEESQKRDESVLEAGDSEIDGEGKNQTGKQAHKLGDTPPTNKKDGWEDEEKRAKWKRFEDEENRKIIVMKLVRRGSTVTEISQRLKISKTEVELMIKDFKSKL